MGKRTSNVASVVLRLTGAIAITAFFSGCQETETRGYALTIGLNEVDPANYSGWRGELSGCEPDARDMKKIATSQGLKAEILLTKDATCDAVLNKLDDLANKLNSGDLLVVSYSGHGGQIPDKNGDEADGLDETWCLYDGQLLDDELHGAWMKFRAGVHILAFSDSCHSGTVLRMTKSDMESPSPMRVRELNEAWSSLRVPPRLDRAKMFSLPEMREAIRVRPYLRKRVGVLPPPTRERNEPTTSQPAGDETERLFVSRSIPPGVSVKTYEQNRDFYDGKGKIAPKEDSNQVKASVILISGCEDAQTSADIGFNGLFTWTLKKVWKDGAFTGDHHRFHEEIRKGVKNEDAGQSPAFSLAGEPNSVFVGQRPYTVK